ncbi:MAG: NUDIX domain-containing protein [Bdellovibrionota bacterium]
MKLNDNVDTTNPWVTLKTSVVLETPWFKFRKDDVKTPKGQNGTYSFIEKKGGAGAVILNEKNEIFLVGQYRYTMDEYTWEIIAGGIEENEDPLETVKREIKEEAGIIANSYELLIKDLHISNCITSERGVIYLVRDIKEIGLQNLDPTEKIAVKKIPFKEAVSLVYQGEIKDAFSIVGILLANQALNKEKK